MVVDPVRNNIIVAGIQYNSNHSLAAINYENETNEMPYNNSDTKFNNYGISIIKGDNTTNITDIQLEDHVRNDSISVNLKNNMIYVINSQKQSISVINGITGEVSDDDIEIDSPLSSIAVDDDQLYALSVDSVLVADAKEKKVLVEIRLGDPNRMGNLKDLSIDPKAGMAYVSDIESNKIYPIKKDSYELDTPISGPEPKGIKLDEESYDIGINENTNMLYSVANNYVRAINGTTNKVVIDKIKVDEDSRLIAVNPTKNMIYVADKHWDNEKMITISVINGTTGTVTDDISIDSFPSSMAINNKTNTLYVTSVNFSSGRPIPKLHVITLNVNGTSNSTDDHIINGTVSNSMAIDSKTNRIYALQNNYLTLIDGKTNNQTDIIELKGVTSRDKISVDPITNKAFVTNSGNNSISIIDGKSKDVIRDIKLKEIIPNNLVVNPGTNITYVSGPRNYFPFRLADSVLPIYIDATTNESIGEPILLSGISGAIIANPSTNKIDVLNQNPPRISVISSK
jgi:YVTN family beta-propeller protein